MKIKVKCHYCNGHGGSNNSCFRCSGNGCIKIGLLEWIFWNIAKYLNCLLDRYGRE